MNCIEAYAYNARRNHSNKSYWWYKEDLRNHIELELNAYMKLAVLETNKPTNKLCDLWEFFIINKLNIIATYGGACIIVAVITSSSATSERVFAMYDS